MGLNKHMMIEEHELEQEIAELTGEGGDWEEECWEEQDPPTAADLARAEELKQRLAELRKVQHDYNTSLGGVSDLCEHCYPDDWPVERQHRGAALRAAKKVVEVDPDWRLTWSWTLGNTLIFYNQASLSGAVMADVLRWEATSSRKRVLDQASRVLASETEWLRGRRESCERRVRQHIAARDADPAERERLIGRRKAEGTKRLAEAAQAIRAAAGRPAQVLSSANGDLPTTLTSLALQARALIAMNDPDVVRVGLAEIADALDAMAGEQQRAA